MSDAHEQMNTKPILFTGKMIRAILDGRKTMTRRVMRPQPSEGGLEWCTAADGAFGAWQDPCLLLDEHSEDGGPCQRVCPYGIPGDLLWVRETWQQVPDGNGGYYIYAADYNANDRNRLKPWSPSIFMPRAASRLTLRVSNVRVERLIEISAWDAMHEGLPPSTHIVADFWGLWDSINAKRGFSWMSNPWVWVIEWDKMWTQNVDAVLKEANV